MRAPERRPAPAGREVRRSSWLVAVLSLLLFAQPACAQDARAGGDAEAALRSGRYAEAIERARAAAPGDERARRTLVRALVEVGRYEEAQEAAADLPNALGEVLYARGRIAEAEAAFRRAVEQGGADRHQAALNLAVLLYQRGEHDEAMKRFDAFIDVYNNSTTLSPADLTAVGRAVSYLGTRETDLFHDAVKAFGEAIAADPTHPEPRVRMGELFLEKYNSPEAYAVLRELLEINPSHPGALLGVARAKEFDGESGEALELVQKSLEINPNLVPARVLLARLQLEAEDAEAAEAELRRALAVNPSSLEALSVLGALHYLRDERARYEEVRGQVLRLNPAYAGFYATVAELAGQHRRYADAAALAQEAVRLDASSWASYAVLGLNQLRIGQVEAARQSLDTSFKGDPFNVWIKNTLDLLDTYPQYQLRKTPRFELFLHGDEADLLFPYVAELAEESYDKLAERYGYRPETPVRVEVYPRHADFSVRTVGLAGLGALGVAFGNVLALDSPAAREAGEFNWGSTLWHELAHAVTLGLSGNRVPRWVTEGISVLEERRARPGWGSETTAEFLTAYDRGELPPVSRLNEGFLRPKSPGHLGLAYHMASLVVEWIEETRGFAALPRMLRGYADGRTTDQLLRSVVGAEPEAVDRQFDAWLRARHPRERTAEFMRLRQQGAQALEAGRLDDAAQRLQAAAEILPGSGEVSALLAQVRLRQEDPRGAAEALAKAVALDENAFQENLKLAELLEAQGDLAGAAAALERVLYVFPYEVQLHTRLADLYTRLGDRPKVVRERRAVVALQPVDRAGALYQLAESLLEAGDRDGARREVLRALEVAPAFERAQELLLRLRAPAGGTR